MTRLLEILNSPERREGARRLREEGRERYGARLAHTPAQANFLFGLGREQQVLDQLNAVPDLTEERRNELYNQLAEALALQGRFDEAMELATDERYKVEYQRKAEALNQIGVKACECPSEIRVPSPDNAKGKAVPVDRRVETVFDGEKVVALVRCDLCKGVSAELSG